VSEKTTLFKTGFSEIITTGILHKKGFFSFLKSLLTQNPCSSIPFFRCRWVSEKTTVFLLRDFSDYQEIGEIHTEITINSCDFFEYQEYSRKNGCRKKRHFFELLVLTTGQKHYIIYNYRKLKFVCQNLFFMLNSAHQI